MEIRSFDEVYQKMQENIRRKLVWRGIISLQSDLEDHILSVSREHSMRSKASSGHAEPSGKDISLRDYKEYKKRLTEIECFHEGYEEAFKKALNGEFVSKGEFLECRFKCKGL